MELKNRFLFTVAVVAAIVVSASCAKEITENSDDAEKRIVAAFLKIDQNNTWTIVNKDSVAVLMTGSGTGRGATDTSYVFVNVSVFDIKGNYLTGYVYGTSTGGDGMSTNNEALAKRLGEYRQTYYYGSRLLSLNETMMSVSRGLRAAIVGKKVGDSFKVLVPSWASDYGQYSTARQSTFPVIYDIEILQIIEDYDEYVLDQLQQYSDSHYAGMGPIKVKDENDNETEVEGVYMAVIANGTGDVLGDGERINFNYTASLLNGFVFTTSIEDVAREHRIYSSDKTYGTILDYTISDPDNASSSEDNTSVTLPIGIRKALTLVKAGDTVVIFVSHSQGTQGADSYNTSSPQYGWWQPLLYRIVIEPASADD